jgi:2'-5' RNA ligase
LSEIRTFIAIDIPDSIRQKIGIIQDELKKERGRVSWAKPGNIHLTLKFLGNVAENRITDVAEAVEKAVEPFESFNFFIKNLGTFPNVRRPRVLWVGIENPPAQLISLAQNIEEELHRIGFPKEKRRFSPHLTIGRVKSILSGEFIEKIKNLKFEGGEVEVKEIVVMKSDLKPTGAIYTPLHKIELK